MSRRRRQGVSGPKPPDYFAPRLIDRRVGGGSRIWAVCLPDREFGAVFLVGVNYAFTAAPKVLMPRDTVVLHVRDMKDKRRVIALVKDVDVVDGRTSLHVQRAFDNDNAGLVTL